MRVDGLSNRGLKEVFEYIPYCYIMKKENNIESLVFKQMKRMKEITDQGHKRARGKVEAKCLDLSKRIIHLEDDLINKGLEIKELEERLILATEKFDKLSA